MLIRYISVLALAFVFQSSPASADVALECGVQYSSQIEVASCVKAQRRVVDQTLEQALGFAQDAAAELDKVTGRDAAKAALNGAQSAWLAYRGAECSYKSALFGGGSGSGIAENSCHVTLTRERITDLMNSLK